MGTNAFDIDDNYDSTKGVKPYIFGIARNIIRRYHRRTKRSPGTMPADSMNGLSLNHHIRQRLDFERRLELDRFKRIVRKMKTALTLKEREAVRLRFIEGLSPKEAAARAGCSIRAFYARLERALKALHEICRDEQ